MNNVLCNLGTYRIMGEDKPALYCVDAPDQETVIKARFNEVHYGLWLKVLTDEEYKDMVEILKKQGNR